MNCDNISLSSGGFSPAQSPSPVPRYVSKIKAVELIYFYFYLFSIFLFLELRVRVRVTRSYSHTVGHIRWHSHKSPDIWKDVEGSGKMMSYSMYNTCWS